MTLGLWIAVIILGLMGLNVLLLLYAINTHNWTLKKFGYIFQLVILVGGLVTILSFEHAREEHVRADIKVTKQQMHVNQLEIDTVLEKVKANRKDTMAYHNYQYQYDQLVQHQHQLTLQVNHQYRSLNDGSIFQKNGGD